MISNPNVHSKSNWLNQQTSILLATNTKPNFFTCSAKLLMMIIVSTPLMKKEVSYPIKSSLPNNFCRVTEQFVQKQLNDLCLVTPPLKSDLMRWFVSTHRSVCDRVGVKLAPETDKEKAFSCETGGTLLGVVYNTVM